YRAIVDIERAQVGRPVEYRPRELGGEGRKRTIRQPNESRSQEGCGAKIGRRIGEGAQEHDDVLDFVRVEEAEALLDVTADAACFERPLELLMSLARAKQDANVAGTRLPYDAGLAIP